MFRLRQNYSYNGFSDHTTSLMYDRLQEMPEIGTLRDSFIQECAESGFHPCVEDFARRLHAAIEDHIDSHVADMHAREMVKEYIQLPRWREIAEEMLRS